MACLVQFRRAGMRDVTLDVDLMEHLATGYMSADVDTLGRCMLAARFMQVDQVGRLWMRGRGNVRVEIPQIAARLAVV